MSEIRFDAWLWQIKIVCAHEISRLGYMSEIRSDAWGW